MKVNKGTPHEFAVIVSLWLFNFSQVNKYGSMIKLKSSLIALLVCLFVSFFVQSDQYKHVLVHLVSVSSFPRGGRLWIPECWSALPNYQEVGKWHFLNNQIRGNYDWWCELMWSLESILQPLLTKRKGKNFPSVISGTSIELLLLSSSEITLLNLQFNRND